MNALRTFLTIEGACLGLSLLVAVLMVAFSFWERVLTAAFGIVIGGLLGYLILWNMGGFQ